MSNHTEDQEKKEQQEGKGQVVTSGEAFEKLSSEIVREFIENIKSGSINLANRPFGEVFVEFLRNKRPELFEKIKDYLHKHELSWDDIKDLPLNTTSILGDLLTKEIFKEFRLKDATRGVVKAFVDKLSGLSDEQNYTDIISQINDLIQNSSLNTESDVDNFLANVRNLFQQLVQVASPEVKKKIKKLNITNQEIIKALTDLGIITEAEATILTRGQVGGIIKELNDTIKEKLKEQITEDRLQELNDLVEKLLFANVVDFIYNSKEKIDSVISHLQSSFKVPSIAEIIGYSSDNFLQWLANSNFANEIRKFPPCQDYLNGNTDKASECYQALIKDIDLVKKYFIEYIKQQNPILGAILEKVFNNQPLSSDDKRELANIFYGSDFRSKIIDYITVAYNLTDEERNRLASLLDSLFDFSSNNLSITLPNGNVLNIPIKKDLKLCEGGCDLEDFADILDLRPVYEFSLSNLDNTPLVRLFQNEFFKIKDNLYSPYQKLKIVLDNGQELEGYINISVDESGNQVVDVLKKPVYEANEKDDLIKTIPLGKVSNLIPLEPLKYNFNTEQEVFKKLLLLFPQLISDRVRQELLEEEVEDKINKIFKQEPKQFKKVKEEAQYEQDVKKALVKQVNKELERIDGEIFKISNLGDLLGYTLMVKAEHLGIKGYEDEFVQIEFYEIKDDKVVFRLIGGIKEIPQDKSKVELDLQLLPEFLKRVKLEFTTFKFRKLGNYKSFERYYNQEANLALSSKYGVNWRRRRGSTKVENKKFHKKVDDKWQEVKYFIKDYKSADEGGNLQDNMVVYSVVLGEGGYELRVCEEINIKYGECGKWKTIKKNMSYNHLLTWLINEQDMYPLTDDEFKVKVAALYKTDKENIGSLGRNWLSLSTILFAAKNIINAVKHHWEEDKEIKSALVYKKMVNMLGAVIRVEVFEELKDEADAEFDSRIWGYINKFKNRLIRADEGKGGAHGSKASEVIKREIFEKVEKKGELNWKDRLKAAGYLLYAMEKGPGPYFRKLGSFAGQGLWIRALLGTKAYIDWKNKNEQLISRLRTEPNNEALKDELVDSEIRFIYSHDKAGELFSKNFPPTLEGLNDNLYSISRAESVYEEMAKKGNFYDLEVAFSSYINNLRIPNAVGTLKALAERVEDEEHYIRFYKDLLWIGLSGFVFGQLRGESREYFNKICRTYGYQIGVLFHSAENLKQILKLMDLIIKTKNIKLEGGYTTFTEYLFDKKGLKPDQVDYYNLSVVNQKNLKKIYNKLEVLWSYAGKDIVSFLDMTDGKMWDLLQEVEQQNREEEKQVLETYMGALTETLDDDWVVDVKKLFVTKDAPYWIDGVLNLNRRLFNELIKTDEGQFEHESKAEAVIDALTNRLHKIDDAIDVEAIYKFLVRKFYARFGGYYETATGGELVKKYLLESIDKISPDVFVEKFMEPLYKKFGYHNELPQRLQELFHYMGFIIHKGSQHFARKNPKAYQEFIEEVFKDPLDRYERYGHTLKNKEGLPMAA